MKRQILRATLLEAAGDTPIHFGLTCTGYRHAPSGHGIALTFENGTTAEADYVVACDGVASAIRQQMLGDEKHYLGLTQILGDAPMLIKHPLLDGGYFWTLGDEGTSMFGYRQADSTHLSYTIHAASEEEVRAQTPAELLQRLQQATLAWHSPVPEIARAIDPANVTVPGGFSRGGLDYLQHVR